MLKKITPLFLFTFLFLLFPKTSLAASLSTGSLNLSDPRPSAVGTTYTFTWSNVTTSTIKCIKVRFSTVSTGVTVPTSMTTTSTTLATSSTYVPNPAGWTMDASTNGTILLTLSGGTAPASASSRTLVLSNITNGSIADTRYFGLFDTYNNIDCSSSPIDSGVVSFIFTNGQLVSLTIDPSLTFSINAVAVGQTINGSATTVATTSTTVPFGPVTSATNGIAAHDLTVSTNAGSGYTVYTRYTGALTSGSGATIPDFTGTNASPATFSAAGTAAFGYTTEDITLGGGTANRFASNKYAAFTTNNNPVVDSSVSVGSTTTRIGYQAGVSSTTAAGTYTTTVIMTIVPSY